MKYYDENYALPEEEYKIARNHGKKSVPMPRITAGEYRGARIAVPNEVRPYTDRAKKAVFDLIGDSIVGTNVMDLFCGSGNIGIEALSRGANYVEFVDKSSDSINIASENLTKLNIPKTKYKLQKDTFEAATLPGSSMKFDFIFADPPFENINNFDYNRVTNLMSEFSLFILKVYFKDFDKSKIKDFKVLDNRKYGINEIFYLQTT